MAELKFLTVCGAGVGTSTLLRININNALAGFDLPGGYSVENVSISRARGMQCDAMVTFESFAEEARDSGNEVIVIKNLMDKKELHEKLKEFLLKKGLIKE